MVSKIIVVGSGAREYAIIKKLRKDYNDLNLTSKLEIICLLTNKNSMIHKYCDEIFDITLLNPKYIIKNPANPPKPTCNAPINPLEAP